MITDSKGSRALPLIMLLLLFLSCATKPNVNPARAAFVRAAEAANVTVRHDDIVSLTHDGVTLMTAPAVTWERMPSTALNDGIDIAFFYASAPYAGYPVGYHTVRASATVKKIGRVDGTFEFIGKMGDVAAKLPATFEIHSLTVPEQVSAQRSFASLTTEQDPESLLILLIDVYCCSNGTCGWRASFASL